MRHTATFDRGEAATTAKATRQDQVICDCDDVSLQIFAGYIKNTPRPFVLEIDKAIPVYHKDSEQSKQPQVDGAEGGEQEVPLPDFDERPEETVHRAPETEDAAAKATQGSVAEEVAEDVGEIIVQHEDGTQQPLQVRLSKTKIKRVLKAICKEIGVKSSKAALEYQGSPLPLDKVPTELGISDGAVLSLRTGR
eukprot:scaffold8269_cov286-Pinguiococcus_pyrenoidosus.AAC.5